MEIIQATLFDYQELDPETRIVVQQRTSEIKALMRRTAQDINEIGQKLIEVKGKLLHGQFGLWLESEFQWTDRTARKYMSIPRSFKSEDLFRFENVGFDTLALLASSSTPDEARQEAIERAQNGETITYTTARNLVNGYKAPEPNYTPTDQKEFDYDSHLDAQADEEKPADYHRLRDDRRSTPSDIYTPQRMDACQTPAYALGPLLPYMSPDWIIWEPAAGEGYLVAALLDNGFKSVVATDLIRQENFFELEPDAWDCIVTNPPFSIQLQWLERCCQLGQPFALLLKVDVLGNKGNQELFDKCGAEVILLDKRVNFKMPNKGWGGGGAQFSTAWFTCGLNIGRQLTYGKVK